MAPALVSDVMMTNDPNAPRDPSQPSQPTPGHPGATDDLAVAPASTAPVPTAPVPTAPVSRRDVPAFLVAALGIGSALAALVGALGTAWTLWTLGMGLTIIAWATFAAVVAVALAIGLIQSRRRAKAKVGWLRLLTGLVAGGAVLATLVPWAGRYLSRPAIHDISTDLADPPTFAVLPLRADNLDAIPTEGSDTAGMTPRQRWAVVHQKHYGDIRSVLVAAPVMDVMDKARRLAEARGWDVAVFEPASGRMEATARATLMGVRQDVVMRVKAADDGRGSVVDMRSVSRDGTGDLGINADLIRDFLRDLSGTTTVLR